ncbi:hypothetical protein GQ43DRAFT_413371 [Delitschia confertaspora ATCC 74209]|uniref:Uncharacterized protein n=1 Tax=Delitschia confertaspora ATCC 74209 TaxID=1513339 RepID=A0A9P4JU40_9PLEO|nr:hypothetical protein GQ43DRAFT_413371 [Delitschia confertaspora ATCC 74209]
MPTDRSNANSGRPLMPSLATNRTAKTPITPRLAPSIASANSSQSGRSIRSNTSTTPRLATASRDDASTPAKSFLNSNITPRSSARKSRVGANSANSTPGATPSATPVNSRPTSTIDLPARDQGQGTNGIGNNGFVRASNSNRPRSVVGGNVTSSTPAPKVGLNSSYNYNGSEVGGASAGSSMFFHALDVKGQDPVTASKKSATFFYANGEQDVTLRPQQIPSPPLSSVGRPSSEAKFFHADSIGEAKGNTTLLTPPIAKSSELLPSLNPTSNPHLRPPSPSKDNIHLSYRKGASQVIRPNLQTRPSPLSLFPGKPQSNAGQSQTRSLDNDRSSKRRSSATSSAIRYSHGKSASLSSIDSFSSLKTVHSHSNESSSLGPSPLATSSSIPESVSSEPPPPTEHLSQTNSPTQQSPVKSNFAQGSLQQMNELAANARRERKVLDLEISNSSLLAINRQLEKEVRKQKAELRRYRRMTRAGGFPTSAAVGGDSSAPGASGMSDTEEGDSVEEQELEESEGDSSFDESAMSPDALADRDFSYRVKDQKRLQLDLSKHQELLIDSQKMNQSIKRCLNWTEELIKDAKKALDYQVHPSDIKLGGRVLDLEEYVGEDTLAESRGLLSPWSPSPQATDPFERPSLGGSDRTDRDSGVDLDVLQPLVSGLNIALSDAGSLISETPSRPPRSTDNIGEIY